MVYAALSNKRYVSDQLGALGRKRIHVHVTDDTPERRSRHALLEPMVMMHGATFVVP